MDSLKARPAAVSDLYSVPAGAPLLNASDINRLAQSSVFGHLPQRDLADMLRWAVVRTLPQRARIFRRGDPGRTLIAVLQGHVKLSTTTAGGREVVLEIAGPGMCFGEMAVLDNQPRTSDATTLSPCRLLAIDGRQFVQVMERSHATMQTILQLMSRRLRAATERVQDNAVLAASARVAKTLLHLAQLQQSAITENSGIKLKLSQSELGGLTGLTRESINKHLAAFREAGWISLAGGSVRLRDVAALRDLVTISGE